MVVPFFRDTKICWRWENNENHPHIVEIGFVVYGYVM